MRLKNLTMMSIFKVLLLAHVFIPLCLMLLIVPIALIAPESISYTRPDTVKLPLGLSLQLGASTSPFMVMLLTMIGSLISLFFTSFFARILIQLPLISNIKLTTSNYRPESEIDPQQAQIPTAK